MDRADGRDGFAEMTIDEVQASCWSRRVLSSAGLPASLKFARGPSTTKSVGSISIVDFIDKEARVCRCAAHKRADVKANSRSVRTPLRES